VRIFITLLVTVAFLGGGLYLAFWNAKKTRMGETFNLSDTKSSDREDGRRDGSRSGQTEEERLEEIANKREADLSLFLEEPYFRLPILTVPIVREGKIMGLLRSRVVLKVENHENFQMAKIIIPRLIDCIFVDLYASMANLWLAENEPNVKVIEGRIKKCVERVLGEKLKPEVFLKEYYFTRNQF
jgi:hypothetical protein